MYLALDEQTSDLVLSAGGGLKRITGVDFVAQQVQSKLRTLLGEWIPDKSVGWLAIADFEKNYNTFEIEKRARIIILETQGVLIINNLQSSYSNRKLDLTFNAVTVYGEIGLTLRS